MIVCPEQQTMVDENFPKTGPTAAHLENLAEAKGSAVATSAVSPSSLADPETRSRIEKKLKWKLDMRCSVFVLIYIMNYLDRNNISAARLKGLQEDLGMDYSQYATCLSILYVGYILMQVPSNIFLGSIPRPSLYISIVMLLWGMISTLSGVATSFTGLVLIRFFLGFVEAAFLPGALMILSKWYTRRELTVRNAILFCGNLISNAFSSLIAAGILSNMQGVLGHAAWRWLFWSKLIIQAIAEVINADHYKKHLASRGRHHDAHCCIGSIHFARSANQLARLHSTGAGVGSAQND